MNVIHISGLMSLPHFNYSSLGTDIGPTTSSRPASSMDVNLDDVCTYFCDLFIFNNSSKLTTISNINQLI